MNDKQQALVDAYLLGVRARTHEDMMAAMKLAKVLEGTLNPTEIAQAKLQAELEVDPMREYHGLNG
jgi:hypothetical protein